MEFNYKNNSQENLDRFIPNRSAMDFGYAQHMLTGSRKRKENPATMVKSASQEAYRKRLAEACNINNRTRILAFKNKPHVPVELIPKYILSPPPKIKSTRYIPKKAQKALRFPNFIDNFCFNLLDWGNCNVLSFAVKNTVYLSKFSISFSEELVTVDGEKGPITSVSWAEDGNLLAVGLNNSLVQLWDTAKTRLLRTLSGGHQERVGSLAWNGCILTTGGMDGRIVNNDVRVKSHIVETYRGHQQEVCGLKWSPSEQQLASGGNDNVVHIWDRSVASSTSPTRWLHRFEEHKAAVKALAWCPFQENLLASGGAGIDQCIKMWNTRSGACLSSVNTGSPVCALLWNENEHEHELLSSQASHGFTENQLTLWKYPSMVKMADLTGHTKRVLYIGQSPNGCTVASAADATLRFWNVFGTPEAAWKAAAKIYRKPFANFSCIR